MNSIYPFEQWPLDLLVDYVLKVHHRGTREQGPVRHTGKTIQIC